MFFTNRTDLLLELAENTNIGGSIHTSFNIDGINISKTVIDEKGSKAINRPCGIYYTINSPIIPDLKNEIKAVCNVLKEFISVNKKKSPRFLVVGLGNPDISADSLGWRTADRILATSSFIDFNKGESIFGNVSVIKTDVSGNSGIDSTLQIKLICAGIDADIVIAVDSLACSSPDRLCRTIQITDSGIHPGSGAGNPRNMLDHSSLGVPVIAIGVPTALEQLYKDRRYFVTHHDIDIRVKRYSYIISKALNKSLNPKITDEELTELIDLS